MSDASTELAERIAGLVVRLMPERPPTPAASPAPPVEYMTPAEAAGFLRSTPKALEHWRARSQGPRYIKHGTMIRYALADLRAFMQAGVQS